MAPHRRSRAGHLLCSRGERVNEISLPRPSRSREWLRDFVGSPQGVRVRHIKAVLVPGGDTYFHLVDAPSLEAVGELTRRARLVTRGSWRR